MSERGISARALPSDIWPRRGDRGRCCNDAISMCACGSEDRSSRKTATSGRDVSDIDHVPVPLSASAARAGRLTSRRPGRKMTALKHRELC